MIYLIVLVALVAVLAFIYMNLYNGIVRASNRCDNAWQTIDAQLQRRSDLIPNLVETVKGYAAHEKETLNAVIEARSGLVNAGTPEERMEANNQLTGALKSLFAVAEAYPDLKANTNFLKLQEDLTDTENRVVYARQSYNDVVLNYNNAITTFPGNLVAGSKFKPRAGFEVASAETRQAPKVQF